MKLSRIYNIFAPLSLLLIAFSIFLSPAQASAASASDWRAGNIIDDGVFYNGSDMSASEVQQFLNARVPQCDTWGAKIYSGSQMRAQYGASQGYPAPYTCLKDYSQNIPGYSADAYCGAIGGGVKSAAQIIKDVSQACGIGSKVLIVLLQKEQSLITDDWPWPSQYQKATGFACPDTAPCDTQYAGYFNQVYRAARQYKVYRANPASYRYKARQNNAIQFNPNIGCGSSTVYIENDATAGLYIYTPYQPNQAALNNLYGSGDGCSAYGNRNFWRMYSDWFGSTRGTPYSWQYAGQDIFTNPERTIRPTATATVAPGQKLYMTVRARNSGNQIWYQNVRLGNVNPRDRISKFYDSSWLGQNRPAQLLESSVAAGETGTFQFAVTAPTQPGTYYEYFSLLIEGSQWLNDVGQHFVINVVEPRTEGISTENSTLEPGEVLSSNSHITSPEGYSSLLLGIDGNLVLYSNFVTGAWKTNTSGSNSRLVMQTDGNLVLYSASNAALWNSGTNGNPNSRLVMQTDGNLVLYSASNAALWNSGTIHNPDKIAYVNTELPTGTLLSNQRIEPANRRSKLILQQDGNLVLYTSNNVAKWSSGTWGRPDSRLVMQGDGNLVIYTRAGQPIWSSGTNGQGPSRLVMQGDGNLVIYRNSGGASWHTSTSLP